MREPTADCVLLGRFNSFPFDSIRCLLNCWPRAVFWVGLGRAALALRVPPSSSSARCVVRRNGNTEFHLFLSFPRRENRNRNRVRVPGLAAPTRRTAAAAPPSSSRLQLHLQLHIQPQLQRQPPLCSPQLQTPLCSRPKKSPRAISSSSKPPERRSQ